jgi:hypothetical protein
MRRALFAAFILSSFGCTEGAPAAPSAGGAESVPAARDAGASSVTGIPSGDDAGAVEVTGIAPAVDAGVDGGSDADAGVTVRVDPCADAGDRGDGAAFADLYRDFFGPTGLANCSAGSICHVPGGTGTDTSGYQCGPDANGCWTSMTTSIVPAGGTMSPEDTALYKVLRKAPPTPGTGPMPRNSAFAFCPPDLARIKAWIAAGAAND